MHSNTGTDAEARLRALLASHPTSLDAHLRLAILLHQQRRSQEALVLAVAAAALAPKSAEAHQLCGEILLDTDPVGAMPALKRALALNPTSQTVRMLLAVAQAQTGDVAAAAETIKPVAAADPSNAVARYSYAAWSGATETAWSPDYVETTFDRFATTFDQRLRSLHYSVPEDATALLHRIAPARDHFSHLLDIGCGTGLGAAALARFYDIRERTGIDLSQRMIDAATAKNLYTRLIHGDIGAALAQSDDNFDLMMALDVFIYIGALEPVFAATAPRLVPGGLFVYSIETAIVADYELRPTVRYVHNVDYVTATAEASGFRAVDGKTVILREELGKRVPGYIGILEKG